MRIEFRIGIHLGDVIAEDGDIHGDGVNIAARLESIAKTGGICISSRVHEEILTKVDLEFEDLGECQLKNIAFPVRVYHVHKRAASIASALSFGAQPLALPDKPSIAVLPFTNMSGNPDNHFFGDGIAEDVLTALSRLRWLFVIARNSSFTYKDRVLDIKQVGRELGVRYVLEGSIRRSGSRVRVTGQLIDAVTGAHVWADRYDRDLDDIFAVQDEITLAVASAIGPAITDAEQQRAVRKPPENLGAWEAYQRGLWHMSKHDDAENRLSRSFFQRANQLDPNFAPAYSALSRTYTIGASSFSEMTIADANKLGEPLSRIAVVLDGNDSGARAQLALVIFLKGDFEGAIHEAQDALSMNPNCAEAFGVKGAILVFSGRPHEGRAAILHYLALSPRDPSRSIRIGQIAASYYFEQDYENSAQTAKQVIRQYPQYPHAYRWLAASLGQLNRTEEARAVVQTLQAIAPSSFDMFAKQRPAIFRVADHAHMLDGLRKAGWCA